jgi:hypothetical protein
LKILHALVDADATHGQVRFQLRMPRLTCTSASLMGARQCAPAAEHMVNQI